MEWPSTFVKALLWGLLVFLQFHDHTACFHEERIALLELKAFLKSKIIHVDVLPSWIDDTKSDCCGWEGITCNTTTAHVIEVSLFNLNQDPNNNLQNTYHWLLNVSLLVPFKELRSLNLSANAIGGCLPNEGFESLSRLKNLETLDLSENNFKRSIIESLSGVKSLKIFNLNANWMEGSFPGQVMAGLSNFSRLEILDLGYNSFSGSISPYIGALSSLKAISLANNKLNGTLPKELCALKKLEELELNDNFFEGILPTCLNNMTSLRLLDVSTNLFVGNISSYLTASPTSLEYIDLGYNHFDGLLHFAIFANHSKLKVIQLASENNKFEIEAEKSGGLPFQLTTLVLSNCNLNKLTGNIPEFLFDQRELEIIDLSHNKLKGSFPIWLVENNIGLQVLHLQNNSFMGTFHLPSDRYTSIWSIDVSDNYLGGQLQADIGKITPNLGSLNLSQNHFEGYPLSSIGDMSGLAYLDLSFNNFSGEVQIELIANCTYLSFLKLSNNRFSGELFSNHFKLESLYSLKSNNNQYTSTLPVVSLQWTYLVSFDISNNNMSGTIPEGIGNMTNLRTLIMRKNSFRGHIPCELGSLKFVDLSHNSLSGSLPSCLNLQHVEHLLLQGNKLTGPIPKAVFNSSSLLTLDLRGNKFFGNIPNEIGALSNLRILLLKGNNFGGIIPKQLCWLKKIGIMDLSMNSLSGTVPHCFQNISFGKVLVSDLVYNIGLLQFQMIPIGSALQRLLEWEGELYDINQEYSQQVEVDLITKYRSNSYSGYILNYMSGLDLSCNKLTGRIPQELGELSSIHALNLSYNQLTGSISQTFSNLAQLESLDLSHNNLSGEIPPALIALNFLEVFNVAYNNLSGKVLDMKAQFGTFGKSCYEGNPFLCGEPLDNSCTREDESHPSPKKYSNASEGKWYEVDPKDFFASFIGSYIILFLGVACLLYIHPYWQQQCFNLIEDLKYRCYYLVFDTSKRLSNGL